jgi:hypothetical protein
MKHPELIRSIPTFIKSMEKLIERYRTAIVLGVSKTEYEDDNELKCLLCNPVGTRYNHTYHQDKILQSSKRSWNHEGSFNEACTKLGCPWIVMLGMTCTDYSEQANCGIMIYNSYDQKTMNKRIKQIKEWIKAYKKVLAI